MRGECKLEKMQIFLIIMLSAVGLECEHAEVLLEITELLVITYSIQPNNFDLEESN